MKQHPPLSHQHNRAELLEQYRRGLVYGADDGLASSGQPLQRAHHQQRVVAVQACCWLVADYHPRAG